LSQENTIKLKTDFENENQYNPKENINENESKNIQKSNLNINLNGSINQREYSGVSEIELHLKLQYINNDEIIVVNSKTKNLENSENA